jgi:hypothetical protein
MSVAAATELQADRLEGLGLEELRAHWRVRYGAPPGLRSPELLALMLAWRIQADREGGLDVDLRRTLRRPAGVRAAPEPSSGTRLVREWEGVRHEVVALGEGGFLYQGDRYRSLSEIARRITGVRWNGPRFFGLRPSADGR